jgi:hypothetical protein
MLSGGAAASIADPEEGGARHLRRHFIGMELDPTYHALATRRLQLGAASRPRNLIFSAYLMRSGLRLRRPEGVPAPSGSAGPRHRLEK